MFSRTKWYWIVFYTATFNILSHIVAVSLIGEKPKYTALTTDLW